MVLATTDPTTCLAPTIAEYLRRAAPLPGGRRVIPSDTGPVIARTVRLNRLAIATIDGRWLEWAPGTAAIAFRPQALGVGGLLGIDALARFRRVTYEIGPPDLLVLEEET